MRKHISFLSACISIRSRSIVLRRINEFSRYKLQDTRQGTQSGRWEGKMNRKLRTVLLNISNGGPTRAITLLFIESLLLCGIIATFNYGDYAPEANAKNRQNSYAPHLNGKLSTLPLTYTRKCRSPFSLSNGFSSGSINWFI